MARWRPELHDPVLCRMHARGMTDSVITSQMVAQGFTVSHRDVVEARRRLGLPQNNVKLRAAYDTERAVPQEKPNPIKFAFFWLRGRLREKPDGYYLDGVPARLEEFMRAANRAARDAGMEQLDFPEWRV